MEVEIEQLKTKANGLLNRFGSQASDQKVGEYRNRLMSLESTNQSRQKDLIEDWISEIMKITKASVTLRRIATGRLGSQNEEDGVVPSIADIDERLANLREQVKTLSDCGVPEEIEDFQQALRNEIRAMREHLTQLEGTYADMCEIRSIIQKGSDDEFSARSRIATELDALAATSVRIAEEASFIRDERDRLKFCLATENPAPPLTDILETDLGCGNVAWQKLYNRGCYETSYN